MPISKSESRRKRRSGGCDSSLDFLSEESPKRTKVHAQRKFAQGSALLPSMVTQFKEIEKEKQKPTESVPTELLPSKRPNTEDFLTFLCFRGTSILPPSLDFFNTASQSEVESTGERKISTEKTIETSPRATNASYTPIIEFGVRKRADPFVNKRVDRRRHHAMAVHALRRKYQNQRMAKIRAIALSKVNDADNSRLDSKTVIRTRSSVKLEQKSKKQLERIKSHTLNKSKRRVKRNMRLRSGGKIISPKTLPVKTKVKPKRAAVTKKKMDTSSDFSSDDNQPLVKAVKSTKAKTVKTSAKSHVSNRPKNVKKPVYKVAPKVAPSATRCTRSGRSIFQPTKLSQRPTRKTKEAAALYMEMLGRKLSVLENENDDETISIDSFPELPNVKRAVQRENEIKTQNRTNKYSTRNSTDLKSKTKSKFSENISKTQKLSKVKKKTPPQKSTLVKKSVAKEVGKKTDLKLMYRERKEIAKPIERPRRTITLNKATTQKKLSMRLRNQDLNKKQKLTKKPLFAPEKKVQNIKAKKPISPKRVEDSNKKVNNKLVEKEILVKKPKEIENDKVKIDDNFSDSDEEPLSQDVELVKEVKMKIDNFNESDDEPLKDLELMKETKIKNVDHFSDSDEKPLKDIEDTKIKDNELKEVKSVKNMELKEVKPAQDIELKQAKPVQDIELKQVEPVKTIQLKEIKSLNDVEIKEVKNIELKDVKLVKEAELKEVKLVKDIDFKEMKLINDIELKEMKPVKDIELKEIKPLKDVEIVKDKKILKQVEDKMLFHEMNIIKEKVDSNEVTFLKETEKDKKPLKEIEKYKKTLKEIEKDKKPLKEIEKDKKPLRDIEKDKKPLREIEKDEKTLKDIVQVETPLEEIKKNDKLLKEIEKDEKPLKEIEKDEDKETDKDKKLLKDVEKDKKPLKEIEKDKKQLKEIEKDKIPIKEIEKDKTLLKEIEKDKKPFKEIEKDKKLFQEIEKDKKPLKEVAKCNKSLKEIEKEKKPLKEIEKEKKSLKEIEKDKKQLKEVETLKGKKLLKDLNIIKEKRPVKEIELKNTKSLLTDFGSVKILDDDISDLDESLQERPKRIDSITEKRKLTKESSSDADVEECNKQEEFSTNRKKAKMDHCGNLSEESLKEQDNIKQTKKIKTDSTFELDEKLKDNERKKSKSIGSMEGGSTKKWSTTKDRKQTKTSTSRESSKKSEKLKKKLDEDFSDSDDEPLKEMSAKDEDNFNESDEEPLKEIQKEFKGSIYNFSDSDEEPLASKIKNDNFELKKETAITAGGSKPAKVETKKLDEKKTKSEEIIKSLKDIKGKDFKTRNIIDSVLPSCSTSPDVASYDFFCKDIGRRFGKGKVNMSNEQIEKWLNDADQELKRESISKSSSTETIFKFEEKANFETEIKPTSTTAPSESNKASVTPEKRSIFQQRRPIINKTKERKDKTPSATAFSPDNESSVYAFEAESEMPVSTPFRSHSRRPSSTTTSKSEDESTKPTPDEDLKRSMTKFRIPTVFRHDDIKNSSSNQQVSLTLGADDQSNQCASIAVQVDITGASINENVGISSDLESSTDIVDDSDGHLFYIPLTGKQTSSDQQVIQGVAVKLGTAGPNGPNQRVIMQAKLVTKPTSSASSSATITSFLPSQTRTASMYPPVGTVQPFRSKPAEAVKPIMKTEIRSTSDHSLSSSEDVKIDRFKTVPTSPSAASSSSSTILNKMRSTFKSRSRTFESTPSPVIVTSFPSQSSPAQIVDAPTFHPTEKEFQDPLEYIDKIRPMAESFGLCRIVPPQGFKPECKVSDDMRFTAYNQYVHKMLYRYGPNFREMTAIKKYLATQNIVLNQAPWIGGMEVDLPRLYQTVQSLGGLKEVIEKKKWPRVAEIMRIPKSAQDRLTKLDDIYCKYLLPYDTLSSVERENLLIQVDLDWENRLKRINNQQYPIKEKDDTTDQSSETESDDGEDTECIVRGRSMALNAFYRIARNTMAMWFKTNEPTVTEVEHEFWKHVNMRTNHICVHSGSIDSGGYGYGFVCSKHSPFARHPWNLKVLTNNPGSILRSMGPIMGVTVPTLHVGMVFSACCWYRDPHGLPWIEYLHTGANKVWYGIPESFNVLFRQALNKLVPNVCRKTPVWLPSDTAMIPPSLLVSNNVSVCRTVQEPGQYIVIFPNAFTSSLCTGYTVSESVFFAQTSWLENSEQIFTELKESCEPSMFSLERLLLSMATDTRCNVDLLKRILSGVQNIRDRESVGRDKLKQLGVTMYERLPQSNKKKRKADTDGEYLCEVCKSNLYVSLVTEMSDDEVYCLQHAAEYLISAKISTKDCKLMYTYTEEELADIVDKVINAIDTKPQKKYARTNV